EKNKLNFYEFSVYVKANEQIFFNDRNTTSSDFSVRDFSYGINFRIPPYLRWDPDTELWTLSVISDYGLKINRLIPFYQPAIKYVTLTNDEFMAILNRERVSDIEYKNTPI